MSSTSNINKQIENINKSLRWLKSHHPEHYDRRFLQLVEERRKLKKIANAKEDNPAVAAYGVSQVGKSYLMNCMLQKNGQPFLLKTADATYNFIEEMNPKTDNTEATGVVTRFSSFNTCKERYSDKYPIMMRCLTVADVIMLLCDGYYHDINDYTIYSESEIKSITEKIYEKYISREENSYSAVKADDVLDIKFYIKKHINNAHSFLNTNFFDTLALVVERIPHLELVDVFSNLWNKSPYQTKLFSKMLDTLVKFKFSKYVYLPPQAMLHDGINENTVMSVQCLNELFLASPKYFTDVYLKDGENFTKLSNLTKSEVCAVCAEIIVKIGEDYLDNTDYYRFEKIGDNIAPQLNNGKINMNTLLKENDLLDFPGARSRVCKQLITLEEDSVLIQVLLRGKVAYLFNMYNDSKRINVLLYCHHHEKNEVAEIPLLLRDWIMNNVGKTMEERKKTLSLTDQISPFFYIGTKFNIDMAAKPETISNEVNAINGRWHQRFFKVLYTECFNADGNLDLEKQKIFLNWTKSGEHFTNSYILRDFKFSGPLVSKLYANERSEESQMLISEEYYTKMRTTFCESEHVKCFFRNPELSWDVCASKDNDGALYIIENLSKISVKLGIARQEQFNDIVNDAIKTVSAIMKEYYVTDDTGEILTENIRKAHNLFREMEFANQSQPDLFGRLIESLQFSESEAYSKMHLLVPQLANIVNSQEFIKDYELIRKRCNRFEGCKNEAEMWDILVKSYHFENRDQAAEFLRNRGIDCSKLFQGANIKRSNSSVIADHMHQLWKEKISDLQIPTVSCEETSIDKIALDYLVSCLLNSAHATNLNLEIENSISPFVDGLDAGTINEDLVADMIATQISNFVTNFGYPFLTKEELDTAHRVAKTYDLPVFEWIERERKESYEDEEITNLFNDILSSVNQYTLAYEMNYNSWLEYMYVASIAHINVPDYDYEANEKLKELLNDLKS